LWIWFWGILITTIPWHIAGLMGEPRRYAIFDYSDPVVAKMAPLVTLSVIGGLVVLCSVLLFFYVLIRTSLAPVSEFMAPLRYALSVNPPATVPALLNGFAFWNVILLALVLIAYGYPIGQFFFLHNQNAPPYSLSREVTK
jgi:cytochrome c oxidase subunit 1